MCVLFTIPVPPSGRRPSLCLTLFAVAPESAFHPPLVLPFGAQKGGTNHFIPRLPPAGSSASSASLPIGPGWSKLVTYEGLSATSCDQNGAIDRLEIITMYHNTMCMRMYTMSIHSVYLVSDLEGSDNHNPLNGEYLSLSVKYCQATVLGDPKQC